jgi:hypothetical protein
MNFPASTLFYDMKTIEVKCCVCGKQFEREAKEVRRSEKLGRRIYCSRKCCGKDNFENIPEDKRHARPENLINGNRLDEFSPFRWHFRNCKRRIKGFELTLGDLKDQWEKQDGKCPYTGWKLKNMPTSDHKDQLPLTPDRASVDRIDSSKGYTRDNIQFVSVMAQYAKHQFGENDLVNFCEAVVKQGRIR